MWCTLCTCTLCKEENPGIVALHWLRSLCGLDAALWDTGTGTVEGWLGNLDTIWIHFPVWISPEPQQIIFLSNSNCLHFLSDNAGDQIHCWSILPKNLQFWSCGWLGQAENYRECRNRLVALNGNWSVTVTPRRQLALRTCNKQMLYREISQILISTSFEGDQHFITHGFRCQS